LDKLTEELGLRLLLEEMIWEIKVKLTNNHKVNNHTEVEMAATREETREGTREETRVP
tara:strand:+ start:223 stop:396 length:174 start_codon:yes stop_codon:yes gene_type:complete